MVFEWYLNGTRMVFEWYLNGIWMVFEWYLNGIWMVFLWGMEGTYEGDKGGHESDLDPPAMDQGDEGA